jgi:hypothetical protein
MSAQAERRAEEIEEALIEEFEEGLEDAVEDDELEPLDEEAA